MSHSLLNIPWSVGESLSPLIILEVDLARAVVQTVLHSHGPVDKGSDLLQFGFSALHNFLVVRHIETVGRQVSLHWGLQPA